MSIIRIGKIPFYRIALCILIIIPYNLFSFHEGVFEIFGTRCAGGQLYWQQFGMFTIEVASELFNTIWARGSCGMK